MSIERHKPEQIVTLLRQIKVGMANEMATPQACKEPRSPKRLTIAKTCVCRQGRRQI
jgi:hypothetical protein